MAIRSEKSSFEEQLKKLETMVEKMENGSLSLEETLKIYEEGMLLARELGKTLDNAEARVQELVDGAQVPFEDAPQQDDLEEDE